MNNTLYTDILVWAFEKQQSGFIKSELDAKFNPKNESWKALYITQIFFNGTNDSPPLISSIYYNDVLNQHYYALTKSGMAAAVDYIELHDARQSSKSAKWYAIIAIGISIIVGIAQILISTIGTQEVRVKNFPDTLRTEVTNFPVPSNTKPLK